MCEPENSHGSGKAHSDPASKGQFNCKDKELTFAPSLRAELSQNKRSQGRAAKRQTNTNEAADSIW